MPGLLEMLARRKVAKLNKVTRELMGRHAHREALTNAEQAADMARTSLPSESAEFISALNSLAAINMHLNRHDIAETALREIVDDAANSGEAEEEYAIALNNLAVACMEQNRKREALTYMERAIVLKRKLFTTERAIYLGSLQDIAFWLGGMGRDAEAIPYFEEMRDIIVGEVGERDPEYAKALQNLAVALSCSGRDKEADVLRRRAANILGERVAESSENALKRESADPEASRDDDVPKVEMAMALYERGQRERAQDIQRWVLARLPQLPLPSIYQQAMGHPLDPFLDHIGDLDKAGLVAENHGDLDKASANFEQVVDIAKISLGDQHPHYIGSLNNLAQVRRKQRRFDEAKQFFHDAMVALRGVAENQDLRLHISSNIIGMYLELADEIAPDPSSSHTRYEEIFDQKPEDYTASMRIRFPLPIEGEPLGGF